MAGKSKFVREAGDVHVFPFEAMQPPQAPRSLADPGNLSYRRSLLDQPHIEPLRSMVLSLRAEDRGFVPDFDPMDGGVNARLLFLLEKPGPMTDPNREGKAGSGFISRDNDDGTAAAMFQFMQQARIPREEAIIWNVIPWWNGTIAISTVEWNDGLTRLGNLIYLLPHLTGAVLVGKKAGRARTFLIERGLATWGSAHPSPRVRAAYPEQFHAIPKIWAEAAGQHP